MFKTGVLISDEKFISRKNYVSSITSFLNKDKNIVIQSPKRYGKTSLIKNVFNQNKYKSIYINIKIAKDLKHLADFIIDETYKIFGIDNFLEKSQDSILGTLKEINAKLNPELQEIAHLTLEKIEKKNKINEIEYFLSSIDILNKFAKKENINIKLALDEFEDIELFENSIIDKMSLLIREHKNITYIFLASIDNIIDNIFYVKKAPFKKLTEKIELKGFDKKELLDYITNFFNTQNIKLDSSIEDIFNFIDCNPYYCIKFMKFLYYNELINKKSQLTQDHYLIALKETFFDNKSYIETILNNIKSKKHHYKVIYSLVFNTTKEIGADILYKTLKSLEDMGHVTKLDRADYKINDIFLELLIKYENNIYNINFKNELYNN
jgi:uncharacterized protein